ncbi:hypothetical protein NZL82_19255 [Sphingomonas sanguinis]|uniref:hypothetical protein n=1 Tax=Sphingomonas sp. LC-1 TaxID=3110957 RepID=UPI0021BA4B03|nr:hypothetical protein [Sphingomonas sp. LC-1]MCT8004007.1 hypothetical protein [Sphingomonas sp. LC-1]
MPAAIKHTKTTSSRSALLILIVANFSSRSSRYNRTVRLDHAANVLVISSSSTVRVMFAVTVITTMTFTVGATLADQAAWAIILALIL